MPGCCTHARQQTLPCCRCCCRRCITKLFPTRSHTVAAQGGINAALGNMTGARRRCAGRLARRSRPPPSRMQAGLQQAAQWARQAQRILPHAPTSTASPPLPSPPLPSPWAPPRRGRLALARVRHHQGQRLAGGPGRDRVHVQGGPRRRVRAGELRAALLPHRRGQDLPGGGRVGVGVGLGGSGWGDGWRQRGLPCLARGRCCVPGARPLGTLLRAARPVGSCRRRPL